VDRLDPDGGSRAGGRWRCPQHRPGPGKPEWRLGDGRDASAAV